MEENNTENKRILLKFYSMGWELDWLKSKKPTLKSYRSRMRDTLSLIEKAPNQEFSLLDVGCGIGVYSTEILRTFSACKLTAFDISQKQIDYANQNLPEQFKERAKFVVADAENFDIKEKFDYIICTELLEHLPDPRKAIKKIVLHSKKETKIVVSVPRIHESGKTGWFYRQVSGSKWIETQDVSKINLNNDYFQFYHKEYKIEELKELLGEVNLRVINVKFCNFNLKNTYLNAAYWVVASPRFDRVLNWLTRNKRASNITVLCQLVSTS